MPTTNWSADELRRIGEAEELRLASTRADGRLRSYVTIWVVRVGDDIFVRSAYGPGNRWYRRAKASGRGRIRAGGVERDVALVDPAADLSAEIDAAYHAKYDRYGAKLVGTVTGPASGDVTLRLMPFPMSDSEGQPSSRQRQNG